MYIYFKILFLEVGREEERGRETRMYKRKIDWLPFSIPPVRDLASNPGMCPDQEANL